MNTTGGTFQDKFKCNDVVSCLKRPCNDAYIKKHPVFSAHQPMHELNVDGSGETCENMLELFTTKIKNFFNVAPIISFRRIASQMDPWSKIDPKKIVLYCVINEHDKLFYAMLIKHAHLVFYICFAIRG